MDKQHIIETWNINNRINLYLLDAIAPEHLDDQLSSKGLDSSWCICIMSG